MKISKDETAAFLRSHERFLLVGHIHPDGDDIGSIVALGRVLRNMGKTADMVIADPVPERFHFLESAKEILTAVPEGAAYDALVFTDLSNIERGGGFAFPEVPSLCIDHHISNTEYTDYLYLRADYAATAELLAELFLDGGFPLDREARNALYMGIGTDSGFFKFSNTSAHTLLMAARLVEGGAEPAFISNHLDVTTKVSMEVYRRVLDTLHYAADGKIGIAAMDETSMAMDGENSDYYVSIPRRVEGVEIGVLLKADGPEATRLSIRSRAYANVSDLAAEFGGGGHIRAAGCTIRLPLKEAEAAFLEKAERYL